MSMSMSMSMSIGSLGWILGTSEKYRYVKYPRVADDFELRRRR